MPPSKEKCNYYIIDGNSYLYRAFFAIPKFSTKDGFVTNAIYGFLKMLLKLIADKHCHEIIVVFDHKGKSFRHEAYKEYKEHRERMPDEMIPQIPVIQQMVDLLGLPQLVIEGVEADDTIATLATQLRTDPLNQIYMITGDKDMMQLIGDNVFIYDTMKNVIYNREKVKEKMGVYPEKITDLLGLMGDSADNIPGVPGVGPKTAVDLLATYDSVEHIIKHREELKGKLKEKFTEFEAQARMSKDLATIKKDVDIAHISLQKQETQVEALITLAKELEFHSSIRELEGLRGADGVAPTSQPSVPVPPCTEITTAETWNIFAKELEAQSQIFCTFNVDHTFLLFPNKENVIKVPCTGVFQEDVKTFLLQMLGKEEKEIICFQLKDLLHFLSDKDTNTALPQLTLFS